MQVLDHADIAHLLAELKDQIARLESKLIPDLDA
jgi:hypothetical protein